MPQGRNYEGGGAGMQPPISTTECTQDGQGGHGPQVPQGRAKQNKHPRATALDPVVNFTKDTKGGGMPQRRARAVVAGRDPADSLPRSANKPG